MLLGASPHPPAAKQAPVEHGHSSTRRTVVMSGGDVTGHKERATMNPDALRSMHYYKVI